MRFLTRDVALIHAKGSVVKGTRRRNIRHTRVNTSIAVRTDGRWLLAASHNTTQRRFVEKLMGKFDSRTRADAHRRLAAAIQAQSNSG